MTLDTREWLQADGLGAYVMGTVCGVRTRRYRPVTPRVGRPVEVQALWVNALAVAAALEPRWKPVLARASSSFQERFWNPATCPFQASSVAAALQIESELACPSAESP